VNYFNAGFSEYNNAREWIAKSFDVNSNSVDKFNSHFEITIRILGGLLSIYHLTADEIFLQRAVGMISSYPRINFRIFSD
jgi:mannosyl-oligosaccharide alpha-1,2-mannosidase